MSKELLYLIGTFLYSSILYSQNIENVKLYTEPDYFEVNVYTTHNNNHEFKNFDSHKNLDTFFINVCYRVKNNLVASNEKALVSTTTHKSKYQDYFILLRTLKTLTDGACNLDSIVDVKFYSVNSLLNSVESPISKQTRIYPTPTRDQLFIELPENTFAQRVYLMDLTGKLVKELPTNKSNFNLKELSNGYYYLKVETNKGIITKKVLKL